MNNIYKNTNYIDIFAKYLDENILYNEYISDGISSDGIVNCDYVDYIAKSIDNNIQYSEYLSDILSETESKKAERIRLMRSKKLNRIINDI